MERSDDVNFSKEVLEMAGKISEIIKQSSTYVEYERAKDYLKDKPKLMEKINSLKIKHMEYAEERNRGQENFDKEKYISQEFYKLMLNENVDTFLMNEEKLVQTISQIYLKVAEQCNLDIFI